MADHAEPEIPKENVDSPKAGGDHAVMPDAFISYASHDATVAAALVEALERAGITCWIAPRDVRAGALYADAIVRAITHAKTFVLVLSESSIDSSHVSKEIERASSKKRPIIALRIDAAPLTPALEYFLSESQWVEAQAGNMQAAYAKLIDAIRGLAPTGTGTAPAERSAVSARAAQRGQPNSRFTHVLIAAGITFVVGYLVVDKFWSKKIGTQQANAALSPAAVPVAPATPTATSISEKSIAVLPFTDMSEKKDQEYFADGMAEELLDLLAKTPGLHVIARTSSFYFKGKQATVSEIARTLAVANILEGSVRKSGNRLRVTTQLIRAENGEHLWSETYDREQEDVFKIQDDIARAVVDKLRLTLLGGEVPHTDTAVVNPQVYNLYLQGRYLLTSDTAEDLVKANECFQKALQLDPGYAPAWAGVAQAALRQVANGYAPVADTVAREVTAAQKAVQLDPTYADGFVALGRSRLMSNFDWSGAREAFEHALQLDPSNSNAQFSVAHLTLSTGNMDDGLHRFQQLLQRDPLNLLERRYIARVLYYAGRLDEAEATVHVVLQVNPSLPAAHYELGRILLARGQVLQAVREFESEKSSWTVLGLPLGYRAQGRTADANAALQKMVDNSAGSEFQVAEAYAYFGNVDQAFAWLDRAVALRDPGIQWLRGDPLLRNLIRDPRYAALLRRLNLPS
ncbi:MAG: TIR domain-containing protein [Steroidobacteraceae bacterium]